MTKGRNVESTAKPLKDDLASPRFPLPPRTPSLPGGARNASGVQPLLERPAAHEPAPHRSGVTPAVAPAFSPEESPSFDKRLTPVIAASWPDQEALSAPTVRPEPHLLIDTNSDPAAASAPAAQPAPAADPPAAQPAPVAHAPSAELPPAADAAPTRATPAPAVSASQRISISLGPASGEHEFWDGAPSYNVTPALISEPPPAKPSRLRSSFAKFLFTAIVAGVMGLLYFEACTVFHVPWQNPRLLAERIRL